MKLATAIKYMGADAPNIGPALTEREVVSFAIDSREVEAGDVFFALSQPDYRNNGFNGDFDDATVYVPSAFEKGAVACVVRPDRYEEHKAELEQFADRLIFADDAIFALQELARHVYQDWGGPVVAITGSAGKTTAKELTAHLLAASGRKVLRNRKNFNNGLGHPLTVLELAADPAYDVAVLEMGMSTPMHEIARLCRITPPDVAVELNVLPVHVEHLGSIENVAAAKAELVEGMKPGGTAVLNADDILVAKMRDLSRGKTALYGLGESAEIRGENVSFESFGATKFTLVTPEGTADVAFPLNGKHNIYNALAAAAVAREFGMSPAAIARALATVAAPPQRGEVTRFAAGFTVINDSYNSNPAALLSMVETLVAGSKNGARRIVVAGEMLELGPEAAEIHRQTGEKIGLSGIDMLLGVRGLARDMVDAAKAKGLVKSVFCEDSDAAGELLAGEIRDGDVVLIKGSRGVRTEKVMDKLLNSFKLEEQGAATT